MHRHYSPSSKLAHTLRTSSFFELEPQAHDLFHFDIEKETRHKTAHEMKATMMVEMIDFAVGFLGPDLELLQNDLVSLGKRHKAYGVIPRHLFSMEHAVIYALEEMLGDNFPKEDRRAWELVFQMIIKAMTEGMTE